MRLSCVRASALKRSSRESAVGCCFQPGRGRPLALAFLAMALERSRERLLGLVHEAPEVLPSAIAALQGLQQKHKVGTACAVRTYVRT